MDPPKYLEPHPKRAYESHQFAGLPSPSVPLHWWKIAVAVGSHRPRILITSVWEHGKLKYKERSFREHQYAEKLGYVGLLESQKKILEIWTSANKRVETIQGFSTWYPTWFQSPNPYDFYHIILSSPPFGYPTLHHWNRQHQNWAKHGRYEKKQPPKSHALNAWLVKKTGFLWPISNSITTTRGWVKNSPPQKKWPNKPGGCNLEAVLVKHIQLSLATYWISMKYYVFFHGSNSKQTQQFKAHIFLSMNATFFLDQ